MSFATLITRPASLSLPSPPPAYRNISSANLPTRSASPVSSARRRPLSPAEARCGDLARRWRKQKRALHPSWKTKKGTVWNDSNILEKHVVDFNLFWSILEKKNTKSEDPGFSKNSDRWPLRMSRRSSSGLLASWKKKRQLGESACSRTAFGEKKHMYEPLCCQNTSKNWCKKLLSTKTYIQRSSLSAKIGSPSWTSLIGLWLRRFLHFSHGLLPAYPGAHRFLMVSHCKHILKTVTSLIIVTYYEEAGRFIAVYGFLLSVYC